MILALVVADERHEAARSHLDGWLGRGVALHAPQDGPDVAAVTARLRRRHATDSAYLCLARRLGTAVWTLDAALARNASDVGLPVKLVS